MSGRVLIVDDEPNHRRSLSISLRLEGYEVIEAADGQQALERLVSQSVDLAVIDLMMPRIDGLELARRLRFAHPEVQVILMSAYHLSQRQIERAQVGDIGFLPKPYELDQLLSQLQARLGGAATPPVVTAPAASQEAAAG